MASSSAKANQADLLGEGGTYAPQASNIRPRATTPDGLFYLDTGEPTPLYIRRQQLMQGLIKSSDFKDTNFNPATQSTNPQDFAYDAQKGMYYYKGSNPRVYVTNDPAQNFDSAQTPTFTVNKLPNKAANYGMTAQGAAAGALAGGKLAGPAGAAVGAGFGAAATLPQASGQQLYLTAGDPSQMPAGQRIGTADEANRAMAAYQAAGISTPAGGFPAVQNTNPFTRTDVQAPMPTNLYSNQGSNGGAALSAEAQRVIANANAMAAQSQQRADSFYQQANAAGTRAAPQITAPSSANQQAVYDRAMGFNAQSGADAIRAARADISGASRLENYQLDQQGINNLEGFRSENSAAGVDALNAFNPRRTFASADQLSNFSAANTAEGADALLRYNPQAAYTDAESLRHFAPDQTGITRLNNYADEAQGPSAAQAMLRSQADADKRTQLAIARSGRGVAGSVQAQRQAISEGGLIEAETRGQGAALAAQENEAFQNRRLQALAQAGSLISQSEAQRLTGLQAAGALMSQQDSQKLAALQAYGQLKAQQDTTELSARQSAGQLNAAGENMKLGATSNAAQLQGQMDAQRLSAINAAAGYRTQGDAIQSNNLQSAANIRLQGSEINQRGAIAASSADLQAQALNLQSLSLAGQVSSDIRNQDIQVLRANLDSSLQTLGLNDQQVRFFSQLGSDREVASQNLQMQAGALGINVQQAQQALDLQWQQFGLSQLSQQQQAQYQQQLLAQNSTQFNSQQSLAAQQQAMQQQQINYNQQQQNRQNTLNTLGSIFQGAGLLFGAANNTPAANNAQQTTGPTGGYQTNLGTGSNSMGMIYDPFSGQWVYPSGTGSTPQAQSSSNYYGLAGSNGKYGSI